MASKFVKCSKEKSFTLLLACLHLIFSALVLTAEVLHPESLTLFSLSKLTVLTSEKKMPCQKSVGITLPDGFDTYKADCYTNDMPILANT